MKVGAAAERGAVTEPAPVIEAENVDRTGPPARCADTPCVETFEDQAPLAEVAPTLSFKVLSHRPPP
jgi:hypothetical protein